MERNFTYCLGDLLMFWISQLPFMAASTRKDTMLFNEFDIMSEHTRSDFTCTKLPALRLLLVLPHITQAEMHGESHIRKI